MPTVKHTGSTNGASTVDRQFRTVDARIKLKRLYPVQQPDPQPPGP